MKHTTALFVLIVVLAALVVGCSDNAPIVKVGETVVDEVDAHRQEYWNHKIEVTTTGGYTMTYHCNKYEEFTSKFDSGLLLRLTDCAPRGGGFDISWPIGYDGPTYEVK